MDKLFWMQPPTLIDVINILYGFLVLCYTYYDDRKSLSYGIAELIFSFVILARTSFLNYHI